MSQLEAPRFFDYKPDAGNGPSTAPPLSYRLAIVAILLAILFVKNLGWDYLVDLEQRFMSVRTAPDFSVGEIRYGYYEVGWPLFFTLKYEYAPTLRVGVSKISPWRVILFACLNFAVGAWLVYATYGYLCECYLALGWRLNGTIFVSVAVILFSLFAKFQGRFEYYNGVGGICGAIVRLSDIMMPALLFCGFLQLFEKLSLGWRWLLAKRS